ncbi:MAG: inositol monophosphatase family protein [Bacillota bacterium]
MINDGKIESCFADIKCSVLDYFRINDVCGIVCELKDKREIVTRVDREVESIIIGRITKEFPGHRIISEESGVSGGESEYVWYIDPVDNTVGLVSGERDISSSISLKHGDRHLRSMIINPRTGEVYEAGDGGSFKNGKRIQTCGGSLYDKSRGISTCAYVTKSRIEKARHIIGRIYENRLPLRISGGSALDLCFVAEGRHIAHVSLGAHTWDVEAGIHIVLSAGGAVEITALYPQNSALGLMAAASGGVMSELGDLFGDLVYDIE